MYLLQCRNTKTVQEFESLLRFYGKNAGMEEIMEWLTEMFSYDFLWKAMIVGGMVALCASLLGVMLVLKRYAMIGDGLSHVCFGALAIALALQMAPMQVAIPVVAVAAICLLHLSENSKIKADSAIGLISSSALAVGVIVNALSGQTKDLNSYMFGSILILEDSQVILSILLSVIVIAVYLCCYHKIFTLTFDEKFARATGVAVNFYNMLLAVLTAITIVVGMRVMGTLLISSLIIFPALTSMQVFTNFRKVVISSAFVSLFCFFLGFAFSYVLEIPTGATIVVCNLMVFLGFRIIGRIVV